MKLPLVPPSASNFAHQFDLLFGVLLGLTVLFGGGVCFLTIYWAVKYRAGSKVVRKRPEHESKPLEIVLIGVPLILGLTIFVWGAKVYLNQRTIPPDSIEIFVMGKQWMWHIQHANGAREMDNLTIPVGRPIRLTMISQDVIHEFYVPAFRLQYQVLPGRYTSQWFIPDKVGRYVFVCNQYCGTDHSRMYGHVDVLPQADYERWLRTHERPGSPTGKGLVEAGRDLFQSQGCVSCHGATDTPEGPSLVGIYRQSRRLAQGSPIVADDNFLRESIAEPGRRIAAGYEDTMPHFGRLDERDLWALVVYLRQLKGADQLPPVAPRMPALEEKN